MTADYHLDFFLAAFFISLGFAAALAIPMFVAVYMYWVKRTELPRWAQIVCLCCGIAGAILFGFTIVTLAAFSYIPWYGSAILLTAYMLGILAAFRPWKRTFWMYTPHLIMIACIVFGIVFGWLICWMLQNVCVTLEPVSINFYINRVHSGDPCQNNAQQPCHVYLTYSTNASTSLIAHFHSATLYKQPGVYIGLDGTGYTWSVDAIYVKMNIEIDRYVYYAELKGLQPDTVYNFISGDLTANSTLSPSKRFTTAPASGPFNFVTGGDVGLTATSKALMDDIKNHNPLYVAIGGDLAYANSMSACYGRWDDWLTYMEKSLYLPNSGLTVPFVASLGNHEAGGFTQPEYRVRFFSHYFAQQPFNGVSPPNLPTNHVHYISNQVLAVLDSNIVQTPASQVPWLQSVLKSAPSGTFKTAIYHAPAYPSVRALTDPNCQASREHFAPVFDQFHLDISFENHDHAYKRTGRLVGGQRDVTGTIYIGDGNMGVAGRYAAGAQSTVSRPYIDVLRGDSFLVIASVNETGYFLQMGTSTNVFDSLVNPFNN